MNQQQAKASLSFEDTGTKSAPVPLFQEETTANQEEVVLEVPTAFISQTNSEAAFAANPEELTKAMVELQTLLASLERKPSNEVPSPATASETLWPEDLNTKQFRGIVEKADGPTWGFDPGFKATQS